MFGAVCSGRPIQLAQQVEQTKFVVTIDNALNINHVAIFLLPQTEFTDPNFTALVYFQLPNLPEFKLLGGLNPVKPSAIFKLNNTTGKLTSYLADDDAMNDMDAAAGGANVTINIGISIEPTPQAEALLAQEKQKNQSALVPSRPPQQQQPPAPQNTQDIAALANKIVGHAYNYLSGFIDASGNVPMKVFDAWWAKFKTKLSNNPHFLEELD